MMRALRLAVAFCCLGVAPASAQSLFATRGLGVPIAPVDARARALGGIGVGLFGLNTSLTNPAEVAGLRRRGIAAALQPGTAAAQVDGVASDIVGTRFPIVHIVNPGPRGTTLTIGYGAVLDQSWGIRRSGLEVLGGDTVAFEDVLRSNGGVAQSTIGIAVPLGTRFAVGVSAGMYTGSLDRQTVRFFPENMETLVPFQTRRRWSFSAPVATVGIRWDPDPVVRIGASVSGSGDLRVRGTLGDAPDRNMSLPTRINVGASGWLAPELLAALSVERALRDGGAAQIGAADPLTEAHSTWRVGGGLEYDGARAIGGRVMPIRLGAQWGQLPYAEPEQGLPTEWSASLGLGLRLAGDEVGPLAVIDSNIERGNRSGALNAQSPNGLTESFWRFTVSLALFGR